MMNERNWLIRTKTNKILGPLSKQKVIDFVQDGTLTDDDELCSGNGFWFWIKEDDLLNKYLFGDEEQNFNPVAEAETKVANNVVKLVKTQGIADKLQSGDVDIDLSNEPEEPITPAIPSQESNITVNMTEDGEELILPDEDDLDFPEPIDYSNNTLPEHEVVEKPLSAVNNNDQDLGVSLSEAAQAMDMEEEEVILPPEDDLDFPDLGEGNTPSLASIMESSETSNEEVEVAQVSPVEDEDSDIIALKAKLALEEERKKALGIPDVPLEQEEDEEDYIEPMVAVEMPRPSAKKKKGSKKKGSKKKKRKSDYSFVYLALIILIVLLFFISKFYSKLVGKDLLSQVNFKMPTSTVLAQEFRVDKKKRFF